MDGIKITAVDLENGDTAEQIINPGQYSLIVTDPLYLFDTRRYANGTIVLILKQAPKEQGE